MIDPPAPPKRRDRPSLRYDMPSEDMVRACNSLLRQIDWSRVALDVAKGETSITYQAALQEVLQEQIEGVLADACNYRDVEEADDTDIETAGGESESDEGSSEHSFVESDESEGGSAEYQASDSSEVG